MYSEIEISEKFPLYTEFNPLVPVRCITPDFDGCIHRFFDSSPLSPSGRFVGLTRLRDETKQPAPGDAADIVLVDLQSGEQRIIAETRAFGTQVGAQVQWGRNDEELYYNDMDLPLWQPFATRINPGTGEKTRLGHTVYMISPDGTTLASPCLRRTELIQSGYGAVVPTIKLPLNDHAAAEDGLYLTDTATGITRLQLSFKQLAAAFPAFRKPPYTGGSFYGFHVKWNPQGTRIMFIIHYRRLFVGNDYSMPFEIITMDRDGSNLHLAMTIQKNGHHPSWCPDGEYITQNRVMDDGQMHFVRYRYDGKNLEVLSSRSGSGHPSLHLDNRHLLTDTYVHESVAFGDNTSPLRLIDIPTDKEMTLVRIRTKPDTENGDLRVDPHPVWDKTYRYVVFNACPAGNRKVFIADLAEMLE